MGGNPAMTSAGNVSFRGGWHKTNGVLSTVLYQVLLNINALKPGVLKSGTLVFS